MILSLLSGLKVFTNPKNILYMILAVVFAFAVWEGFKFVNTAVENAVTVAEQTILIEAYAAEAEVQRLLLAQAKRATAISEAAREALELREGELQDIKNSAIGATDESDGEIAPVLADTLRAIRNR